MFAVLALLAYTRHSPTAPHQSKTVISLSQGRSQDFLRGSHTASNIFVMAFSPRNIVGCFLKKGLQRGGGVTGTPGPPSLRPCKYYSISIVAQYILTLISPPVYRPLPRFFPLSPRLIAIGPKNIPVLATPRIKAPL